MDKAITILVILFIFGQSKLWYPETILVLPHNTNMTFHWKENLDEQTFEPCTK